MKIINIYIKCVLFFLLGCVFIYFYAIVRAPISTSKIRRSEYTTDEANAVVGITSFIIDKCNTRILDGPQLIISNNGSREYTIKDYDNGSLTMFYNGVITQGE